MDATTSHIQSLPGTPTPFGATLLDNGDVNFSLASSQATKVTLVLSPTNTGAPPIEIPLDPKINKTGDVWHIQVKNPMLPLYYGYKIEGGALNTDDKILLDPYAKSVSTTNQWGKNLDYRPLGEILPNKPFDWEGDTPPNIPLNELVIYELHVRGFTQDPSSKVTHPGTFQGIIEKIPYLVDLGINAVELMPIHEFNECEYFLAHPDAPKERCNFWGYSTVNFFAPMQRYATTEAPGAAIDEFKDLVKNLHKHGIEVILDVVYNHTAEGDSRGPTLSFKGIDNDIYYMVDPIHDYRNYSGCGNTFNGNHPRVLELIIDSLRYWVTEMHVDGFRFDLASILTRMPDGEPRNPSALVRAITDDPILANVKLIAEAWDAAGLYQVGNFAAATRRWSEWNGRYRDTVRNFIKGTLGNAGEFAMRLCGSEDLYHVRWPCSSINFITAHDGFTLADLVSYNTKHNMDNGENNRDGNNDNCSWNCGVEGPTTDLKIVNLRNRQMRNHLLALFISQGIPMLLMGDEYGHTKKGNNNTWCHDNNLNWFSWEMLEENRELYRFCQQLIKLLKRHPCLQQTKFLTNEDIDWHGTVPFRPNWGDGNSFLAMTYKERNTDKRLYMAFNSSDKPIHLQLPPPQPDHVWRWVVNTSQTSPADCFEEGFGPLLPSLSYTLPEYSAIVLDQEKK